MEQAKAAKKIIDYRWIENGHILLWLIKDTCWALEFKPGGIFMIFPTVAVAFYILWRSWDIRSERYHNIAVCCWILANSVWMNGEFFVQEMRPVAAGLFITGLVVILVYYVLWFRKDREEEVDSIGGKVDRHRQTIKRNDSVIFQAISSDDYIRLRLLLQNGHNVDELDEYGQTALFRVVYNKSLHQLKLAKLLIEFGANVNTIKDDGTTPLFWSKGEVTALLLEHGADIDIRSNIQATPMHHVTDVHTLNILLGAGANINALDKYGSAPLHDYVYFGSDLVKCAVERGANVHVADETGCTPLISLAKAEGYDEDESADLIETAKILLKHGADVNAVDEEGNSAFLYAQKNNPILAQYLASLNQV